MPAGSQTARILLQLNDLCRDLSWLKEHPHYAEFRQSGHWDTIDAQCAAWAGANALMVQHVEGDMLLESREAIRAGVVHATENGLRLRWEIAPESRATLFIREMLPLRRVVALVEDGVVRLFLPRATERVEVV